MKYKSFFTTAVAVAAALVITGSALAQQIPPEKWVSPGYTLVPFRLTPAVSEAEKHTAYQILKSAELLGAFDGAETMNPRPGSGVYAAAVGDIIIAQVDSRNTCSSNECSWVVLRNGKLESRVDSCDVLDYVAISTDRKHIKICDVTIDLK